MGPVLRFAVCGLLCFVKKQELIYDRLAFVFDFVAYVFRVCNSIVMIITIESPDWAYNLILLLHAFVLVGFTRWCVYACGIATENTKVATKYTFKQDNSWCCRYPRRLHRLLCSRKNDRQDRKIQPAGEFVIQGVILPVDTVTKLCLFLDPLELIHLSQASRVLDFCINAKDSPWRQQYYTVVQNERTAASATDAADANAHAPAAPAESLFMKCGSDTKRDSTSVELDQDIEHEHAHNVIAKAPVAPPRRESKQQVLSKYKQQLAREHQANLNENNKRLIALAISSGVTMVVVAIIAVAHDIFSRIVDSSGKMSFMMDFAGFLLCAAAIMCCVYGVILVMRRCRCDRVLLGIVMTIFVTVILYCCVMLSIPVVRFVRGIDRDGNLFLMSTNNKHDWPIHCNIDTDTPPYPETLAYSFHEYFACYENMYRRFQSTDLDLDRQPWPIAATPHYHNNKTFANTTYMSSAVSSELMNRLRTSCQVATCAYDRDLPLFSVNPCDDKDLIGGIRMLNFIDILVAHETYDHIVPREIRGSPPR